jgi:hypothetical protein
MPGPPQAHNAKLTCDAGYWLEDINRSHGALEVTKYRDQQDFCK